MEIKELKKKDHKKVIQYAIKGMHFGLYLKDKFEEANKEMFRAYSERYTPTEKYVF